MYFLFSFLSTIESAVLKYTTLFVWFSIFFLMWSILLQVFGTSLWYTFLCTLFSWCIMNGPLCLWLHFLSQICVVWYNRARLLLLWLHGISFSSGKQSTCQCRRCMGHGLGRLPRGGNDNPLQYSCLKNSMNSRDLQTSVHEVVKILSYSNHVSRMFTHFE